MPSEARQARDGPSWRPPEPRRSEGTRSAAKGQGRAGAPRPARKQGHADLKRSLRPYRANQNSANQGGVACDKATPTLTSRPSLHISDAGLAAWIIRRISAYPVLQVVPHLARRSYGELRRDLFGGAGFRMTGPPTLRSSPPNLLGGRRW